tara:strand:- start:222 stop:581 length:360 start_codon:yes stop_codon:yes gene_type:complete
MSFNRSCQIQNEGKPYDLTPIDHPKLICKKSCSFEAAMKASGQAQSDQLRMAIATTYETLVLKIKDVFTSVTNQELKLVDEKCRTDTNHKDTQLYNFAHSATNAIFPEKNPAKGLGAEP